MKSRNTITFMLMSVSILLLLILQVLWLQNAYEKAFFDLRRDSNYIFRNTLFAIRDSLFLKNVRPLPADSLWQPSDRIEAVQFINKPGGDSMKVRMRSSSAVQIYVNSDAHANNDSIINALKPIAQHFNEPVQRGKSFFIRLSPDTISLDTLKTMFTAALTDANLPVKFLVKHELIPDERISPFRARIDSSPAEASREMELSIYRDTLKLEVVRMNPMSRYSASLLNFKGFILKAIAPQILFSVLLTIMTIGAFVVLFRSLRSQQRLMELKNDFISNVTHELKTPVATVSVALEALKNFHGLDDPKLTREYLEIAQSELNRLTLMTDKILKAGAFENKDIIIQKEAVDLREISQQILDSMKLLFEKSKAEVTFQHEGNNFTVLGEASHLTNVIYNLLDNALKYSLNQPRLNVLLQETADQIIWSVQDNGLGIASEYKTKIFEKFFRVPTGDIHNIKGYGLGLSYVSSVVKAHGGTVNVESEPGKGSIFKIMLPK